MSINHLSSSEGHWWSHYPTTPAQTSSSSSHHPIPIISSSQQYSSNATFWVAAPMFDLNNNEDDDESTDETPKERLFEKPLTPSDVGKLNRLVIPKQHAEKHFPLNAAAENGLLLGFEDEAGKSWRFRYSYWNSSQSYVLTKGWSRFVKEKRLDAGDIVVFARHRLDTGRFFIGWRRRQEEPTAVFGGWGSLFSSAHQTQSTGPSSPSTNNSISISYHQHDAAAAAAGGDGGGSSSSGQVQNPSSSGSGISKTVRLFGVNLHATDHDSSEPSTPLPHQQYYYPSNHHMDISFSGGAADADAYRQG